MTKTTRTYSPAPKHLNLTQSQKRVRRAMLEKNCAISFDGQYATTADEFVPLKTFRALLYKGVIRYDARHEQYVLVELEPGGINNVGGAKRIALVKQVEALKSQNGMSELAFAEMLFEIAGQMKPKYLYARDAAAVLKRFTAQA